MLVHVRKILEPEFAAWVGIFALSYAVLSISVSIILSPWFSWTHNALSDLGVSDVAPLFNSGLIGTGILLSIFSLSLAQVEGGESTLGFAGGLGLFFVGLSAVGVGVFTEAYLLMHLLFSLSCFVLLILSSLLLGVHFLLRRESRGLGVLALSIGILSIVPWLVLKVPGLAIKEAVSAFPAIAWFIALSAKLRKSRKKR